MISRLARAATSSFVRSSNGVAWPSLLALRRAARRARGLRARGCRDPLRCLLRRARRVDLLRRAAGSNAIPFPLLQKPSRGQAPRHAPDPKHPSPPPVQRAEGRPVGRRSPKWRRKLPAPLLGTSLRTLRPRRTRAARTTPSAAVPRRAARRPGAGQTSFLYALFAEAGPGGAGAGRGAQSGQRLRLQYGRRQGEW